MNCPKNEHLSQKMKGVEDYFNTQFLQTGPPTTEPHREEDMVVSAPDKFRLFGKASRLVNGLALRGVFSSVGVWRSGIRNNIRPPNSQDNIKLCDFRTKAKNLPSSGLTPPLWGLVTSAGSVLLRKV